MTGRAIPPSLLALAICSLPQSASPALVRPEVVSPGNSSRITQVEARCPTFSWGAVVGARSYELVVYSLDRGPQEAEAVEARPVLHHSLPGSALSWTPSMDQCLEPGGRYAWSLRAVGDVGEGAWSLAALFEVSRVPTPAEMEHALELLERYLDVHEPAELQTGQPARAARLRRGLEALRLAKHGDPESLEAPSMTSSEAPAVPAAPGDERRARNKPRRGTHGPGQQLVVRRASGDAARDLESLVADGATPTLGSPSLSLSGNLSLAAASNIFKDGGALLWEDGSNTALGRSALSSNTSGFRNSAFGAYALASNENGYCNVAAGRMALPDNTSGSQNSAVGAYALFSNTTGGQNVAVGTYALYANSYGATQLWHASLNTAIGYNTLGNNSTGSRNTAVGAYALLDNTQGIKNTSIGSNALWNNLDGDENTVVGTWALSYNTTGSSNIALGYRAGRSTDGSHNILIGNEGVASESYTIRIGTEYDGDDNTGQNSTFVAGIFGQTAFQGSPVYVTYQGKLGTNTASSRRVKDDIRDMEESSSAVLELRPVTFRFRRDARGEASDGGDAQVSEHRRYGLIAEEVAEVLPELVVYDDDGNPSGVRYYLLSRLLLNELQKQQRRIEEQTGQLAAQQERLAALERQLAEIRRLQAPP